MIKKLPFSLIIFRLLMAPVVLLIAWYYREHKYLIGIICYLAIVSDIFDGIIARQVGVVTPRLRLWDSNVDFIYWLCVCVAAGICFPGLVQQNYFFILPLFILEPIPDIIYYTRFKKFGCAHNYLSKLFGLALLTSFSFLFFGDYAGPPFYIAVFVGILSQLDRILIALILPSRICDIPSCYHADLIRKGISFKKYKLFHS